MRLPAVLPALCGLALTLAAIPLAAGQEADECSDSTPCEWHIDVDADGFPDFAEGELAFEGSLGDWYEIRVYNFDDEDHVLRASDLGIEFTARTLDDPDVEEDGTTRYGPFELDAVGTFTLTDGTASDSVTIRIFEGDVSDEGGGAAGPAASDDGEGEAAEDGDDNGSPGPALAVLLLSVLAAALVAGRWK